MQLKTSVALIVKLNVPNAVGVPEITPEVVLKARPVLPFRLGLMAYPVMGPEPVVFGESVVMATPKVHAGGVA